MTRARDVANIDGLLTTTGDTYYASAAGTPARLGIGSTSQVLTVAAGIPTWATPASGTTFVGCSIYKSGVQNIANNTATTLTWDSEVFDTDTFHSTSVNTDRITIPSGKSGKYLFCWNVAYTAANTGYRGNTFLKNGTTVNYQYTPAVGTAAEMSLCATYIDSATAGDYYTLTAEQNSGGALDIRGGAIRSFFSCQYLGA